VLDCGILIHGFRSIGLVQLIIALRYFSLPRFLYFGMTITFLTRYGLATKCDRKSRIIILKLKLEVLEAMCCRKDAGSSAAAVRDSFVDG
jgi:hypothetical protein